MFIMGAIPVIFAILIVIPMIMPSGVPIDAANSNDILSLEFSKQQMRKVSFGITERLAAERTELLSIQSDADVIYSVTNDGYPEPDKKFNLDKNQMKKLTALIKETGFMKIPTDSFPIREDVTEFTKFGVKITLNGVTQQVQWPEQNATEKFIPPILFAVETELQAIIDQIIDK
ncbi:MAG: conserved hypothetical exported protein [Marine Group I thaumarchaeote]|nr:MAG: conserved hypothetical exported protein [Marine Group I thaumarchaeote]